jgi:hypothetical protein
MGLLLPCLHSPFDSLGWSLDVFLAWNRQNVRFSILLSREATQEFSCGLQPAVRDPTLPAKPLRGAGVLPACALSCAPLGLTGQVGIAYGGVNPSAKILRPSRG